MNIIFYKNYSNNNVINKNIELYNEFNCTLKDDTNIINPFIMIQSDDSLKNCNYCYINDFNRYYYIKNITYKKGKILEIELEIDVLMSFKNMILNSTQLVNKSEFYFNQNLQDNELPLHSDTKYDIINIATLPINNGIYVLETNGGV